jgi:hypothetical protein
MYYHSIVTMGMRPDDYWNMPIGLFLDLWTCHRQYLGYDKPKRYVDIDEIFQGA